MHELCTSGRLDDMRIADRLKGWCAPRNRTATALPPGWRLLASTQMMEVVCHNEAACKENCDGSQGRERCTKGAPIKKKGNVIVSDLIGKEQGQLDIPQDL